MREGGNTGRKARNGLSGCHGNRLFRRFSDALPFRLRSSASPSAVPPSSYFTFSPSLCLRTQLALRSLGNSPAAGEGMKLATNKKPVFNVAVALYKWSAALGIRVCRSRRRTKKKKTGNFMNRNENWQTWSRGVAEKSPRPLTPLA